PNRDAGKRVLSRFFCARCRNTEYLPYQFWILDFGFWICRPKRSQIENRKLDLHCFRFLRRVTVIAVRINLQFLDHRLAELRLRQHAPDGELDDLLRFLLEHFLDGRFAKSARIQGVAERETRSEARR